MALAFVVSWQGAVEPKSPKSKAVSTGMFSRWLQAVIDSLRAALSWLSQAYHSSMMFPLRRFPCR